MVKIIEISADKTYAIRKEILRENRDLPVSFEGDFHTDTFHLGVFRNEKLEGIATCIKQENKVFTGAQFQLRGMAVLPEVRGLGFGKNLISMAIKRLKAKGIHVLWCNARIIALPFYEKLGFEVVGEPFEIDTIGTHYLLVKAL
jgi:ribosomal protein S18 acetylase RimI-like enzyme